MRPMRSTLLWMAQSQRMQETVPRLPFAQRAVRRFMPGERVEDAISLHLHKISKSRDKLARFNALFLNFAKHSYLPAL